VADDYQGSGLGTVLASLLADHRPRPARRVITHVADGNRRAMSLLTAFGLPQRASDGRLFIDLNDSGTEHEDTSPAAATEHRGSVSRCYPRWPRSAGGDTAMTGSLLVPEGEQG